MIELLKNPSGDIDVVTAPPEATGSGYLDTTIPKISSGDQAKINTLKSTIQSLKGEIEVNLLFTRVNQL